MKLNIKLFPLLILTLVFYGCRPSMTSEEKDPRPNIVLIMADDMGFSDIGAFGSEIHTPNIDNLANNGLVMTQFYNTGRCCPTRASLLTGLYAHQTGMGDMTGDYGYPAYKGHLNKRCVTIGEVLKEAGYTTMMTGKWHLGGEKQERWPINRGFEKFYGVPKGGGIYFYPPLIDRPVYRNDQKVQPDSTFYSTDAFNRNAANFIKDHQNNEKPFFLYVAHIAPHFPLQARKEDILKYRGKYKKGFESIRKARYEKLKASGIIKNNTKLTPPDERVKNWNDLSGAQQDSMDKKMATYAAQIDRMDQGIGDIIEALKSAGEYENTLVIFLSDNGAASVNDLREVKGGDGPIGSRNCWQAYGPSWANVSNTPFRLYKKWVHEGGIATPLIAHYPEIIKNHRIDRRVGHVIDIMPTVLELANADYPEKYNGEKIQPLEGESLVPVFKNQGQGKKRTLFWEHEGNKAVRKGDWKLVSQFPENEWHLFNINNDRAEMRDLRQKKPDKVEELKGLYQHWADRVGVIPREQLTSR